jgi:hypothetical protein
VVDRRERLAAICLSLPEVTRRKGQHDKYSVRRRTVAYYLNDHHGDRIQAVCLKAPPGMRDAFVATDPDRFLVPSYLGPKGWVSLRLDGRSVNWAEVEALVTDSYRLVAPKTLVRRLVEGSTARRSPRPRRR